jgi:hypothetical protein
MKLKRERFEPCSRGVGEKARKAFTPGQFGRIFLSASQDFPAPKTWVVALPGIEPGFED